MDSVIDVEQLSKRYIIGHNMAHNDSGDGLKEVITKRVRNIFSGTNKTAKEDFWALDDVSFSLENGDRLGIVGRNGAGKSTLLKLISRITEPTSGKIRIKGKVTSLLEIGTGFHPELSGRENIYLNGAVLGMNRAEIKKKFDSIVDFSEIEQFLDTPVKRYSSGMYVKLAFAVASHLESEIMIVDEVLAVGDAQFQKKCLGKLEDVGKSGRTILFVSHNISAVANLCNKGLYLNKGKTEGIDSVSSVIEQYMGNMSKNEAVFEGKAITWAKMSQLNDSLLLETEFIKKSDNSIPNLGFVINDYQGQPIFGSNLIVDLQENNEDELRRTVTGRMAVQIEQPKLVDGMYGLSLSFGDGTEDYFQEKDCIRFEVAGMVKKTQISRKIGGDISPLCHWMFQL